MTPLPVPPLPVPPLAPPRVPRLRVRSLAVSHGAVGALRQVDLAVHAGTCVALLGGNGAGKSTLLRCIAGALRPDAGQVELDGRDVAGLATHDLCRLGIALVPEGRQVFPHLTVAENLMLGAYARRRDPAVADDLARAYADYPLLAARRGVHAGQLSGGEQQLLAIARAWMSRPRLLLLDEPTLGLATALRSDILIRLANLAHRHDVAVLFAEQNAPLARRHADEAWLLDRGSIRFQPDWSTA